MTGEIPVQRYLNDTAESALLDVRSPAEYARGHIPGALSFPLFSDEERAQVGTLYKQETPEEAMQRGLEIVGPKMPVLIARARAISTGRRLVVHCWRGGKRSASVAWLLNFAGLDVSVLKGGYKAYRSYAHQWFAETAFQFRVIGGKTGSNKTEILRQLHARNEQVLDLEGLAHHKGSAFGAIGEEPQPTTEQYENAVFHTLHAMDMSRRIWTEDESRSIGKVYIAETVWSKIKAAPIIVLDVPMKARVQNLVHTYAGHRDPQLLIEAFERIRKRLGGQHADAAIKALRAGDMHQAASIALAYYDKTYYYALEHSKAQLIEKFAPGEMPVDDLCDALISLANQMSSATAVF